MSQIGIKQSSYLLKHNNHLTLSVCQHYFRFPCWITNRKLVWPLFLFVESDIPRSPMWIMIAIAIILENENNWIIITSKPETSDKRSRYWYVMSSKIVGSMITPSAILRKQLIYQYCGINSVLSINLAIKQRKRMEMSK